MSLFGWSASDIVLAIQIANRIRETWFDRFRRADAQYLDFGEDVKQFGQLLQRFLTTFEKVSQTRGRLLSVREFKEWDAQACRDRQEVVGSFTRTLEECENLFQRNGQYLSRDVRVWDNAKWILGGSSDEAERLRTRLNLHAAKINLLIEFDTIATVRAIRNDVENLPVKIHRQLTERQDGILPPVPPPLNERYHEALYRDAPPTFYKLENFPLPEGLDALIAAYEASTASSPASRSNRRICTPSMDQMNNLIKARWIFDRLLGSTQLRNCGLESVWACALETALKNLQDEYDRWQPVLEQNTENIAALNEESFQIWHSTDRSAAQLITDPDPSQMEEKILEAPLESSNEQMRKDLIVFRRPNKEFRVLTYTTLNSSGGDTTIHYEKKILNIHSAHIIPRYALRPYGVKTQLRDDFELCFPGANSVHKYTFQNEDDRLKFQQALLGYKVVFQDTCNWLLHFSSFTSKLKGSGLLQIFQPKALPPIPTTSSQNDSFPGAQGLDRNDSVVSSRSTLTASTGLSGRTAKSNGSIIAEHPHAPLLVIFTQISGQHTFLRLPFSYDVEIKPERCQCASRDKEEQLNCMETFLGGTQKFLRTSEFPLRRFSAPAESQWNLALLSRPQHPGFEKKMEKLRHINYLGIQTTVPAYQFQNAIEYATKIRDGELDNFLRGQQQARFESETLKVHARASSSLSVLSPGSRKCSNATELESLSNAAVPTPRDRAPSSRSVFSSTSHRHSNAPELESISSPRGRPSFGNAAELESISNSTERASVSTLSELESFTSAHELE